VDWQLILVFLSVAAAGAYLVRQTWRTWRGKGAGCGGGCRCDGKASASKNSDARFIPAEQLTLRLRQRD
jgi:hypothetical protein